MIKTLSKEKILEKVRKKEKKRRKEIYSSYKEKWLNKSE
jgi:hypothetical protein